MNDETKELTQAFEVKCKKCGSMNVELEVEGGQIYNEFESDPCWVQISCNACGNSVKFFA